MFRGPTKGNFAALAWSSLAFLGLMALLFALLTGSQPVMVHKSTFYVQSVYPPTPSSTGVLHPPVIRDDVWERYDLTNPLGKSIWIMVSTHTAHSQVLFMEYQPAFTPTGLPKREWESNAGCMGDFVPVEVKPESTISVAIPARLRGGTPVLTVVRIPYSYDSPYSSHSSSILRRLLSHIRGMSSDGCINVPLEPELPGLPGKPDLVVHHPP